MTREEALNEAVSAYREIAPVADGVLSISHNGYRAKLHRLLDALARLDQVPESEGGWREIATDPPPEDTEMLAGLWDETGAYIANDHFSSKGQCWVDWHSNMHNNPPTHWRPMLPSPSVGTRGKRG